MMEFWDSHAHLNDPTYAHDLERVIFRAEQRGVVRMLVVGYDLPSSEKAIAIAKRYPEFLNAAVGCHPHEADRFGEPVLKELETMSREDVVVAIGETGLDFYKNYSKPEHQREALLAQIDLARRRRLPLVLHIRNAFPDVFSLLEKSPAEYGGIFHCFSGGIPEAQKAVALGFHVSFSGSLTFGSKRLEEALKCLPKDRILLETDAPYLAPPPYRGQRNEPAYLLEVARKAAEVLEKELGDIAKGTFKNTQDLLQRNAKNLDSGGQEGDI